MVRTKTSMLKKTLNEINSERDLKSNKTTLRSGSKKKHCESEALLTKVLSKAPTTLSIDLSTNARSKSRTNCSTSPSTRSPIARIVNSAR